MAAFDARFSGVTGRAKGLQIGQVEGQFRVGSDGFNMIDFEPAAGAAGPAFEAVPAQGGDAQSGPASRARDVCGVAKLPHWLHSNRPDNSQLMGGLPGMDKVQFRLNAYGDELVVEHFGIEEREISAEEAIAINSCEIRDALSDIREFLRQILERIEKT
jgi:hypothetical protein